MDFLGGQDLGLSRTRPEVRTSVGKALMGWEEVGICCRDTYAVVPAPTAWSCEFRRYPLILDPQFPRLGIGVMIKLFSLREFVKLTPLSQEIKCSVNCERSALGRD